MYPGNASLTGIEPFYFKESVGREAAHQLTNHVLLGNVVALRIDGLRVK